MADNHYKKSVRNLNGNETLKRLEQIYNSTNSIAKLGYNTEFDYDMYPYYSLRYGNRGGAAWVYESSEILLVTEIGITSISVDVLSK